MERLLHKPIALSKSKKTRQSDGVEVKPYCIIELCHMYQISRNTFKKWLLPFAQEIGKKNGRYYSVLQVTLIFDKLGLPYMIFEMD